MVGVGVGGKGLFRGGTNHFRSPSWTSSRAILFFVYINGLADHQVKLQVILFADDTGAYQNQIFTGDMSNYIHLPGPIHSLGQLQSYLSRSDFNPI